MKKLPILAIVMSMLAWGAGAQAQVLPNNRHIFVNVANTGGVKYNVDGAFYGGPSNTYYIKADGGGLNELRAGPAVVGHAGRSEREHRRRQAEFDCRSPRASGAVRTDTLGISAQSPSASI